MSHKKVTTTAVNVKVEASNATKRHKLNEASSASSTKISNVAIGSPKKQSGRMLKISDTKIHIPFRDNNDNFTNLLPQMSKEIQCNFNKKYMRRSDQNNNTTRRSDRNTAARNT